MFWWKRLEHYQMWLMFISSKVTSKINWFFLPQVIWRQAGWSCGQLIVVVVWYEKMLCFCEIWPMRCGGASLFTVLMQDRSKSWSVMLDYTQLLSDELKLFQQDKSVTLHMRRRKFVRCFTVSLWTINCCLIRKDAVFLWNLMGGAERLFMKYD